MFAPHCPACERRVLLSTDHIVSGPYPGLVLRCFCGELLAWNQRPPSQVANRPGTGALAGVTVR